MCLIKKAEIGSWFFREPGIGFAKTYGNFQKGNRMEQVPGVKQAEGGYVAKAYEAGTVGIT